MIQLESIINQLLFQHNYVVIPSFGAIKGELVGSEVDEISNSIKPPRKVLTFDQSVKIDKDRLLQQSVAQHLDLTSSLAEEQINDYVEQLTKKLAQLGKYRLEGVGEFTLDVSKQIEFTQLNEVNFFGDSFGMPELFYKPILRDKTMTKEQPNHKKAIKKAPVTKSSDVSISKEVDQKSNKAVYVIIPAIVLVAVVGFFLLHKKGHLDDQALQSGNEASVQVDEVGLVEDTSSTTEVEEDTTVDTLIGDDMQFYIITGVFSTEENAQAYIDTHDGCQIEQQGEYFRVFVEKYATKEEALNHLPDFKSVYGENLWVLEY